MLLDENQHFLVEKILLEKHRANSSRVVKIRIRSISLMAFKLICKVS